MVYMHEWARAQNEGQIFYNLTFFLSSLIAERFGEPPTVALIHGSCPKNY